MLNSLKWQQTCCAWHGEYAEGVPAYVKRTEPEVLALLA